MEPELAAEAVESMQAAPGAGAGSEKEREKSTLLERMDAGEEGSEVIVAEDEPAAELERAEEGREALNETRKQAQEALVREFPDALAEGTELYEACREELAYLRESGSPLADDPQAEYKVARRMARLLGLSQHAAAAQEPPVAAAPKSAVQTARRKLRPMPVGGAPVESPATTLERRVAGAKSTGDMLELMREIGTPFEALLKR